MFSRMYARSSSPLTLSIIYWYHIELYPREYLANNSKITSITNHLSRKFRSWFTFESIFCKPQLISSDKSNTCFCNGSINNHLTHSFVLILRGIIHRRPLCSISVIWYLTDFPSQLSVLNAYNLLPQPLHLPAVSWVIAIISYLNNNPTCHTRYYLSEVHQIMTLV